MPPRAGPAGATMAPLLAHEDVEAGVTTRLGPAEIAMFAFYLVLLVLAVVADVRAPVWFVATALSAACAVLWVVARRQLGNAFAVRAEAHSLVTTGLYAKVRHPIYVFGTLAFMLVLLALERWSALAVWAILVPVQVLRARREEQVLAEAFGPQYEEYRRTTWF